MHTSSLLVEKAQALAAAGRHAEVVAYLGAQDGRELEESPSLALLYGTAQSRLGRHASGKSQRSRVAPSTRGAPSRW
jgi:hypothetical protein